MNIQEATKKAVAENKAIINLRDTTISFVPYAPNGCWWIVSNNDEVVKVSSKPALWNPTYHDFLSDDWAVGSQKIVLEKNIKHENSKKCENCGAWGRATANYCGRCGINFQKSV